MSGIFGRKRSSLITPESSKNAQVPRKQILLTSSRTSSVNNDSLLLRKTRDGSKLKIVQHSKVPVVSTTPVQSPRQNPYFTPTDKNQQKITHSKPYTGNNINLSSTTEITCLKIEYELDRIVAMLAELENDDLALRVEKFSTKNRRITPSLGRIEEHPPNCEGPDNENLRRRETIIPDELKLQIHLVQTEIRGLQDVAAKSKQECEIFNAICQELKEEITSQKEFFKEIKNVSGSCSAESIGSPYPAKRVLATTDNEIRGRLLNLTIVVGIFLYHCLFLFNDSKWIE